MHIKIVNINLSWLEHTVDLNICTPEVLFVPKKREKRYVLSAVCEF